MKKHLLVAGIAASAFASLPAYGDFKVIQNGSLVKSPPQAAPQPEKSPYGHYRLIEAGGEAAAPAPVSAPVKVAEAASSLRAYPDRVPAAPNAPNVERLTWEAQRLQVEIERLRADLALVQAELAAAQQDRQPRPERITGINKTLDRLEQRMADAGTAILRISFGSSSTKFIPADDVGAALVAAGKSANRVNVYGHADNIGSPERNRLVALARAMSARKYMVEKGVPTGKVFAISRGAGEPIADNDSEDGRAKNRRVDIEFRR